MTRIKIINFLYILLACITIWAFSLLFIGGEVGVAFAAINNTDYKLDNGVAIVYENTPHTQIASVQVWIKTGSVNETAANNGISHFLEHILFKGTSKFGADEIDSVVEAHGGIMNAGTSKDYTMYYITLPAAHIETAFEVLSEMVFNAAFIPDEIEKEKPVVVQEIQRKFDNPTYDMWHDAMALAYAGTPYQMEIIGTEDNVNSFTSDTLRGYYKSHYHPENMTLVVVGDTDSDTVNTLAKKYFAQKSSVSPVAGYNEPWKPQLEKSEQKTYHKDVSQEYKLLLYPVPAVAKDAPIYEVLSEMLSGGEYSLLNQALKFDQRLVTAVYCGEYLSKSSGIYIVNMVTAPNGGGKAVAAFDKLIQGIIAGKFSDSELEKAKNRLKSDKIFQKEKASSLAGDIGYSYTLELHDYYKTYVDNIDRVTKRDIIDLAEGIFNSPRLEYATLPDTE